jgi:hypothetical protein
MIGSRIDGLLYTQTRLLSAHVCQDEYTQYQQTHRSRFWYRAGGRLHAQVVEKAKTGGGVVATRSHAQRKHVTALSRRLPLPPYPRCEAAIRRRSWIAGIHAAGEFVPRRGDFHSVDIHDFHPGGILSDAIAIVEGRPTGNYVSLAEPKQLAERKVVGTLAGERGVRGRVERSEVVAVCRQEARRRQVEVLSPGRDRLSSSSRTIVRLALRETAGYFKLPAGEISTLKTPVDWRSLAQRAKAAQGHDQAHFVSQKFRHWTPHHRMHAGPHPFWENPRGRPGGMR